MDVVRPNSTSVHKVWWALATLLATESKGRGMTDMPPEGDAGGWWKAVDGKWYPPERHPDYVPPIVDSPEPVADVEGEWHQASDGKFYAGPPGSSGVKTPAEHGDPAPGRLSTADPGAPVPVLTPETNGMAIAALVMSVIGYVLVGFGTLFAIIFGVIALGQLRKPANDERGRGLAVAALILSLLQVAIAVAVVTVLAVSIAAGNWRDSREAERAAEEIARENEERARENREATEGTRENECRKELGRLRAAGARYFRETGEQPTSRGQVEKYFINPLDEEDRKYDFDKDGSGRLVPVDGSDCPEDLD